MKRLNVFALIGAIFFNLCITLSIAILAYALLLSALLLSAWISVASFIVSPVLVVGAHLLNLQAFTFFRMGTACLLSAAGTALIPILINVGKKMFDFSKQYIAFNLDFIYH